ncbi:MAG: hypothetical protein LBU37_05170, partial [Tannerellaceae bacterium]|nr:hypothetical protein [Tannerellaceae bacterium]
MVSKKGIDYKKVSGEIFILMMLLPLFVVAQPRDTAQWNLDGTLKTKFEWGLNSGDIRFNLRNSRLGL